MTAYREPAYLESYGRQSLPMTEKSQRLVAIIAFVSADDGRRARSYREIAAGVRNLIETKPDCVVVSSYHRILPADLLEKTCFSIFTTPLRRPIAGGRASIGR
jgi:hypothetical protein